MSLVLGYKVYINAQKIENFVINGILPNEKLQQKQRLVVIITFALSVIFLVIYVTLIVEWWFIDLKTQKLLDLRIFLGFTEFVLYLYTAILFKGSQIKIKRVLRNIKIGRNQRTGQLGAYGSYFFVTFVIVTIACLINVFTTGHYNTCGIVGQVLILIAKLMVKIALFILLAKVELDLFLRTQVLATGKVCIFALDSFGRETFRFYIDWRDSEASTEDIEKFYKMTTDSSLNSAQGCNRVGCSIMKMKRQITLECDKDDLTTEGDYSASPTSPELQH